jgi:hypothetical protein
LNSILTNLASRLRVRLEHIRTFCEASNSLLGQLALRRELLLAQLAPRPTALTGFGNSQLLTSTNPALVVY